jgi:hypothetical protein
VLERQARELQRREIALREAARTPEVAKPKPESLVAPCGWWECDFCGRGFHSYGE